MKVFSYPFNICYVKFIFFRKNLSFRERSSERHNIPRRQTIVQISAIISEIKSL